MNHAPKVAVIVLNWNGKQDTLECLDSVFKIDYPNFEVVVVDNGSRDESVPAIRRAFPQAHLIETGRNLGYAGGNNVGIRHALEQNAEFIFILNNDTQVSPDVLTQLVGTARIHPKAAVLGPVIYEMDNNATIATAGEYFDNKLNCINFKQGEFETSIKENPDCYPADWVTGAAFFTQASALTNVGLFDERFFLVHEDSDWCFRAKKAGYCCLIVPGAKVWHKVSASFNGESSPLRIYFSTRNRLLFAERHLPASLWLKILLQSLTRVLPKKLILPNSSLSIRLLYWSLREFWQDPRQKARRQGILDYCLRRFGDCPPAIRRLNAPEATSSPGGTSIND